MPKLRGSALNSFIFWGVVCPAYILFGYNNVVAGGLWLFRHGSTSFLQLTLCVQLVLSRLKTRDFKVCPLHSHATTTSVADICYAMRTGTVVALYTLGCFFGSLSCIFIGDRLGRIRTIMLGAAVSIIGAVLQASSFSLGQLIVGRLVSGFGLGALTATAPNWQTECSKSVHRGRAVLMLGPFNGVGLSIASWVNFGMSYAAGNVAWRFPLALPALWSTIIIVILAAFDLPESPRWLVKKGRIQEARDVLSLLFDTTPDATEISFDIQEMEMSLAMAGEARFLDILRNGPGRLFHRTCLAVSGQVFQQMNGINALAYYMATIFQEYLGLSGEIASILAAVSFMWLAVCAPMGVLTVDTFGRRKLMLFGAIGMGLCMALIAGCLSQPANRAAIIATATFMFLFYLFFATGFFGITFLYAAEVAPLSHRVPITSISTGCAWLFNFVVAEVTPVGLASINWRYYIVYACINLFLIFPSVYFFFPETNGRTLEEIDEIFLKSENIFRTVRISHDPSLDDSNAEKALADNVEMTGTRKDPSNITA